MLRRFGSWLERNAGHGCHLRVVYWTILRCSRLLLVTAMGVVVVSSGGVLCASGKPLPTSPPQPPCQGLPSQHIQGPRAPSKSDLVIWNCSSTEARQCHACPFTPEACHPSWHHAIPSSCYGYRFAR
jgi:hypothetical protein